MPAMTLPGMPYSRPRAAPTFCEPCVRAWGLRIALGWARPARRCRRRLAHRYGSYAPALATRVYLTVRRGLIVAFFVVAADIHAQFLDLAGQGVTAPAQQHGGVATAACGVLEGGLDHDPLECRYGAVEQVRLAAAQGLVGPVAQGLFPVADRCAVLGLAEQLRRQVVDMHFAPGGHHRDPAAGVLQLA